MRFNQENRSIVFFFLAGICLHLFSAVLRNACSMYALYVPRYILYKVPRYLACIYIVQGYYANTKWETFQIQNGGGIQPGHPPSRSDLMPTSCHTRLMRSAASTQKSGEAVPSDSLDGQGGRALPRVSGDGSPLSDMPSSKMGVTKTPHRTSRHLDAK